MRKFTILTLLYITVLFTNKAYAILMAINNENCIDKSLIPSNKPTIYSLETALSNYYFNNKGVFNISSSPIDSELPKANIRLFYGMLNHTFSGVDSFYIPHDARLTLSVVSGNPSKQGLTSSLEFMASFAKYQTSKSGTEMQYNDHVYGAAYGLMLGGGKNLRMYVRASVGVMYYAGELKSTTNILNKNVTDIQEFHKLTYYYNAVVGIDILIGSRFGISTEIGFSRIPFVSVGIVI